MKFCTVLLMFFVSFGAANAQSTSSTEAAAPQTLAPAPLHITKLDIIDTVVGTGDTVVNGNKVVVQYTGWLYNHKALNLHGPKFDSSYDAGTPLTFLVGGREVIRGWDLGLIGMKVGGKRTLMIPAYLGYSTKGSGNIPPNTHLVFDIELLEIKK